MILARSTARASSVRLLLIAIKLSLSSAEHSSSVFFFQAEDGIRYANVTGVQTCALPISLRLTAPKAPEWRWAERARAGRSDGAARSEDRRVGKECRYRWSRYP